MPSKLKFKGDDSKKKKRKNREDGEEGPSRRRRKDGDDEADDTWVRPDNTLEIRGPTFIYHPSDPHPLCVSFDATRGRVFLTSTDKDVKTEGEDASDDEGHRPGPSQEDAGAGGVLAKTPTDVSQVWVVTRVAGSPTVNLRTGVASTTGSGETKFLSCDEHGLVSAFREARGPQEEWTPIVFPDGMIAFQNVYEKYLSVDEVAGGAMALRGDSDEVGFNERFWVKIQNKYKKEAHEEERVKKEGVGKQKIDEAETKYVALSPVLCSYCSDASKSYLPGVGSWEIYRFASRKVRGK